jgi:very-short-patch-repair endonuclease
MLIIELDGGYQSLPEQQISDEQRTADLQEMGYRVIRFTNEELFQEINLVLTQIKNALNVNAPL